MVVTGMLLHFIQPLSHCFHVLLAMHTPPTRLRQRCSCMRLARRSECSMASTVSMSGASPSMRASVKAIIASKQLPNSAAARRAAASLRRRGGKHGCLQRWRGLFGVPQAWDVQQTGGFPPCKLLKTTFCELNSLPLWCATRNGGCIWTGGRHGMHSFHDHFQLFASLLPLGLALNGGHLILCGSASRAGLVSSC